MLEIKNPAIKRKETIDNNDYEHISTLEKICNEYDKTSLKLEIDYKKSRSDSRTSKRNHINEFMYFDNNILIGYIGICDFGGDTLEVNGMVHPEYRRQGIFKQLFDLVKEEWHKRDSQKMLLLTDRESVMGQHFIKYTHAKYNNSEYEMFLQNDSNHEYTSDHVVLRKATNEDAREIAVQNALYFEEPFREEDIILPEEEEKCGFTIYMAELDHKIIGKVHLELTDRVGGIYGLGVLKEYRGKGYGREILTKAINKLKEMNAKDIMLQVATKNENALKLYLSCGFMKTSTMDYYELCK